MFESQNRSVAIILDNCSSHNVESSDLTKIKLYFLPPNTTSIGQPLDAGYYSFIFIRFYSYLGIIECTKRNYRTFLAKSKLDYIYKNKENIDHKEQPFSIDFYSAAKRFVKSFESVSVDTIKNCWKKCDIYKSNSISQMNLFNYSLLNPPLFLFLRQLLHLPLCLILSLFLFLMNLFLSLHLLLFRLLQIMKTIF